MPTSTTLDRQPHRTGEAEKAADYNRLHILTNAGMQRMPACSAPFALSIAASRCRLDVNYVLTPPLKLVVGASSDRPFVKPIRHRKRQDFLGGLGDVSADAALTCPRSTSPLNQNAFQ